MTPEHTPKKTRERPVFFRRRDVILVAALLACAGLWLWLTLPGGAGAYAVVSVTGGAEPQSFTVPLGRGDTIHIENAALPVTLEVKDGAIRFVHSVCPDHRCEAFGALRREGEWALCAPAGVRVSVREP